MEVPTAGVVPGFDPLEDGLGQLGAGVPVVLVEQLEVSNEFRGGGVNQDAPPRNRRSQTATRPPSTGMTAPFR
jgi:hypothetical protein